MAAPNLTSLLLNLMGIGSTIAPQEPASGWFALSAGLLGASDLLNLPSKPQTSVGTSLVVIELKPRIRTALSFLASDTVDPATKTISLRGFLLKEARHPTDARFSEFNGVFAFDATLTVGTAALPSTSVFADPSNAARTKWVSAISVTTDKTVGGVVVSGDKANHAAEMTFDGASHRFLALSFDTGTLAGVLPLKRQY